MKILKFFACFCVIILFLVGCNGKPAEVPELFPCQVSVSNGESKIENVTILLVSQTNDGSSWAASGVTDKNGLATISTTCYNWKGAGVPKGEYKIALSKEPVLERISSEEYLSMSENEQEAYNLKQQKMLESMAREIPTALANIASSPLSLSVQENGENKLVVDVAEYNGKTASKK